LHLEILLFPCLGCRMLRIVARSKIQRPRITDKNLRYEGSIAIDTRLLELADIAPSEMVQVVNVSTGARFETYVIEGGPGVLALNGGAARLGEVGDELIVIAYSLMDSAEAARHHIRKVNVDEHNQPIKQTAKSKKQRAGSGKTL
jgi:aspartate 1-decarboxylase